VLVGLDHVQLAMPAGGEDRARQFYAAVLGMVEAPKPHELAPRGDLKRPAQCLGGRCPSPAGTGAGQARKARLMGSQPTT
jgi:hypothetical protein